MSNASLQATAHDHEPGHAARPIANPEQPSDVERAHDVQRALRALVRHCPQYARVLAGKPGVRLAGHMVTGEVASVTAKGLEALLTAHAQLTRACAIDPGLDTNTFMDRLLARTDPHARTTGRTGLHPQAPLDRAVPLRSVEGLPASGCPAESTQHRRP